MIAMANILINLLNTMKKNDYTCDLYKQIARQLKRHSTITIEQAIIAIVEQLYRLVKDPYAKLCNYRIAHSGDSAVHRAPNNPVRYVLELSSALAFILARL